MKNIQQYNFSSTASIYASSTNLDETSKIQPLSNYANLK